jgi:hypothetical protein
MLCAERLCELPLEVRVLVANMDIETYTRMYLYDTGFRDYANTEYAVDDFIARFVVTRMEDYTLYRINNIEYYKYDNGNQGWYMNGKFHKNGGPAVIFANGDEYWYINDKYHRDDGPAIIHNNGYKAYYLNGKIHRLDDPAIIHEDGREEYWEYGMRVK